MRFDSARFASYAQRERCFMHQPVVATKKAAQGRPFFRNAAICSALARLEARIALADHEHLAATTHDLAVAMPLFRGLQGRKHLHGWLLKDDSGQDKPESVAGAKACGKRDGESTARAYAWRFPWLE